MKIIISLALANKIHALAKKTEHLCRLERISYLGSIGTRSNKVIPDTVFECVEFIYQESPEWFSIGCDSEEVELEINEVPLTKVLGVIEDSLPLGILAATTFVRLTNLLETQLNALKK